MSSQAQMDAYGVLCHLEVHPFIPAINPAIVDASSPGVTTMDKADLPCPLCVKMLPRVPVYSLDGEVEQVPVSQSITIQLLWARACGC